VRPPRIVFACAAVSTPAACHAVGEPAPPGRGVSVRASAGTTSRASLGGRTTPAAV
jgi:hypothetical protein